MLANALTFSRQIMLNHLQAGHRALDGTAGNGHDTLLLAQAVGKTGRVWAFDIQQIALDNTLCRLKDAQADEQVCLILAGHETLSTYINEALDLAVFNFGYLPNGDKTIITQAQTSIIALQSALDLLKPKGMLLAMIYSGHSGGASEAQAITQWAQALPQQAFHVLHYQFINQQNSPPFLLAIEKR